MKSDFFDILMLIQKYFPMDSFFADQADAPKKMAILQDEKNEILDRAKKYYSLILQSTEMSRKEKVKTLQTTEPFSLYPDIWEDFLDEMEVS